MKSVDCRVKPGTKMSLRKIDPGAKGKYPNRQAAEADMAANLKLLEDYQEILYTQTEKALLIVLQALDAGGKDGTVRHVMGAFNPMGCSVVSFKKPTDRELAHDFLWRVHVHAPARGRIAIFNRSHYEDILVARVHNLVPKKVWTRRYDHIANFERLLVDSGVVIRKFFLYISKDEQRERLEERLQDPKKNWKFDPADLEERKKWDDYMAAYEDIFEKTSTDEAPWYVIPANHKWYRNLQISQILVDTFREMRLKYPDPIPDLAKIRITD